MDAERVVQVLAFAEGAVPTLPARERKDAERLLAICKEAWLTGQEDPGSWKRELSSLIEVLARRSAPAMPYAALGRALLADLHGDEAMARSLVAEFETKLSQLGL